jgi:hypothetical protein
MASMMPHARLQPMAPMSIVRTSSRPEFATLSEPVKVSTMIKPKSASLIRWVGSSRRLGDSTGMVIRITKLAIQ